MLDVSHTLITDDERVIRNMLKEILEFEGYKISLANIWREALDCIQKHKIDLIFLDIKMKAMDGLETVKEIRKLGFTIPVIMISGHETIEIAVEATKYGAFDFLEKPLDLNRLLLVTRNSLSQQISKIKQRLPKLPAILGKSKAIETIKLLIDKIASTRSRVLTTDNRIDQLLIGYVLRTHKSHGFRSS